MSTEKKAPDGVNTLTIDDDGGVTSTLMHVPNKMSTEKDREDAEKISRNEVLPNPRLELEHVDEVMKTWLDYHYKGVLAGIQHARQGERERLNRFANKLVTEIYEAVNQRRKANDVDIIIDEFLEQEKSK